MSIFEFTDYKGFLQSYLTSLPKKGRGEINRMAKALSVHPTLISQVLKGPKDFTIEQAHHLTTHLGLQPLETDYFILLIQKERAGTRNLKNYYLAKIETVKSQSLHLTGRIKEHRTLSDSDRSVFYSSWLYSAIRLFVSTGPGQSLESVAQRFEISRKTAADILAFLTQCQLCTEENGLFQMGTQHTHLPFGSPFLGKHHTNWRLQALHRTDDLTLEELMFTSPFSIRRQDFTVIREQIIDLIKSSSKLIKDSPAEDIACLNIDLFWIAKRGRT